MLARGEAVGGPRRESYRVRDPLCSRKSGGLSKTPGDASNDQVTVFRSYLDTIMTNKIFGIFIISILTDLQFSIIYNPDTRQKQAVEAPRKRRALHSHRPRTLQPYIT
jgi:hypothetical protein